MSVRHRRYGLVVTRRGLLLAIVVVVALVPLSHYLLVWRALSGTQVRTSDFTATYVGSEVWRSGQGAHLYERAIEPARKLGLNLPDFETFWSLGYIEHPQPESARVLLEDFRADPVAHALGTPSGRIEIFSPTIDSFGYADCPGHPVWLEPAEWLGGHPSRFRLQLVANQPRRRLHSQLDVGAYSQEGKVRGREAVAMHPADAAERGIADRSCVRLFNDRGSCLAGVTLTEDVRPGVVQLSTGAWYDPDPGDPSFCRHGNPNVLTADRPSSALSQGNTGQLAMVEVEPYAATPPEVSVHRPPRIAERRGEPGT